MNPSGDGGDVKLESVVRVRKTKMHVSTVWTLEKFTEKLAAMRQLYDRAETTGTEAADDDDDDNDAEDVFFDPDDAWMEDSPLSSHFSLPAHL